MNLPSDSKKSTAHAGWRRRKFIVTIAKTAGIYTLTSLPGFSNVKSIKHPSAEMTVQQVIDLILKTIPGAPFTETVDTLKSGNPQQIVKGIVTSTFATLEVIEKAHKLGANFIIVHEPTFYNHLDDTKWLERDEVYQYKYNLLQKYNIAIWRFHDYWHSHLPDGVQEGVLVALGWEKYADKENFRIINLPASPLKEIVSHLKEKLGIPMLRVIGDPTHVCRRIAIFPGASGGRRQITALQQDKPDLFICGELSEWETSEYIRDARFKGEKRALVVLGHAVSEEPGMQWLVTWLQPKIRYIKVTHIAAKNPFTWM
jgi:putative NIF3 family GTP cyclohydrolase 1 type 2